MCGAPATTVADRATDPAFAGWRAATSNVNNGIGGAQAVQPQFFVEHAGWVETWFECNEAGSKYRGTALCIRPVYKVTARSQADGRSSVLLQSSFVAP
jgi:type IV pilus assembly protein PilX